jgi:hypothetical protein
MNKYRIQEAEFSIPATWVDQSLNIFKIPGANGHSEASLVISRDKRGKGQSFFDYLQAQGKQAQEQLPEFVLVASNRFPLGDVECGWFEYTWKSAPGTLHVRQIFYPLLEAKVLISTLTTAPKDISHHDGAWRQAMIHSIQLFQAK